MKNKVHYCKRFKMWTSHTYKSCTKAQVVLVTGKWKTEVKPEKQSNPRGWIYADHSKIKINPNENDLVGFKKTNKLIYDKKNMSFNINHGDYLLFDNDGFCYLLEKNN